MVIDIDDNCYDDEEMTFEEWIEIFKPLDVIRNDEGNIAAIHSYPCEAGIPEYMREKGAKYIWTIIDDGEGNYVLDNGIHRVNRHAYIFTENSWDCDYSIMLTEDDLFQIHF